MSFEKIENSHLNESFYRIKHSSGLTVIVYPKKGFTSSYAIIGTNFGSINSRFISNGEEITVPDGTAHYLEHKLFESEDGDAFEKYAKTGASANAYTSFDRTCYNFSCTDRFYESLEILLELVQSPYFTKETIAKEQGIISQEIKMYDDDSDWKVRMNLMQALYKNHPINIDIAGSVESIAEITPEILYKCYDSYYKLDSMVLCVVGNVDPEKVLKIVDDNIKIRENTDTKSIFPEEPYEVAEKYIEQKMSVSIPMFEIGFKTKPNDDLPFVEENIMRRIMLSAFSGDCSSLYRRLLDKGLVNSTFCYATMIGKGYRSIIFNSESRNPDEAAKEILESVRELHEKGISEEDFEMVKRGIYGSTAKSFDKLSNIASGIISSEFFGYKYFDLVDKIETITVEDVNKFLKNIIDPENYAVSVIRCID